MKTFQKAFVGQTNFEELQIGFMPDLIILFLSPGYEHTNSFVEELSSRYPTSIITGCSTSGEIIDTRVEDNSVVLNAISFSTTELKIASRNIEKVGSSIEVGRELIQELTNEDLRHVLIFSDGLNVNGDDLVEGITSEIMEGVGVTGGMAGDGTDFNKTFVIKNNEVLDGEIVAVGFYGSALKIGYSSKGGWNSFGIDRVVTRSDKNILYEIDGQPALKLYKSYLGEKAEDLPGSGLLFPLSMRVDENSDPLVRTLLSINEEDQSIVFAGNIPEGSFVRLMKANVDRLIVGAEGSAQLAKDSIDEQAEFALLISCVGRRVVLKQLVEEEVEAVREVLGEKPIMSGFYSYGELAPFGKFQACQLHNQTMTITTFSEAV